MVSTGSNDLFRNKLSLWWIRLAVVLIIFPVVVVALKSPDILQVYLISDLVSASSIPVLVIGLSDACYFWRGFEVVVGGLGGLLTVFIFGTICTYYQGPRFFSWIKQSTLSRQAVLTPKFQSRLRQCTRRSVSFAAGEWALRR